MKRIKIRKFINAIYSGNYPCSPKLQTSEQLNKNIQRNLQISQSLKKNKKLSKE